MVGNITYVLDGEPISDDLLECDGSTVLIDDYPQLFDVIGTTYGGNGTTNFALPTFENHGDNRYYIVASEIIVEDNTSDWKPPTDDKKVFSPPGLAKKQRNIIVFNQPLLKFTYGIDTSGLGEGTAADKWAVHPITHNSMEDYPEFLLWDCRLIAIFFQSVTANSNIDVEIYKNGNGQGQRVWAERIRNSQKITVKNPITKFPSFKASDNFRVFFSDAGSNDPENPNVTLYFQITEAIPNLFSFGVTSDQGILDQIIGGLGQGLGQGLGLGLGL